MTHATQSASLLRRPTITIPDLVTLHAGYARHLPNVAQGAEQLRFGRLGQLILRCRKYHGRWYYQHVGEVDARSS